ncbi:unnamed protein product [Cochlearia groenlandica]
MDAAHYYLEGNADAVEFCPHKPYTNLVAASTYTLEEGDLPSRSGSVYLFDIGDVEDIGLNLLQKVETAGVFDIRWSHGGDGGGNVSLAQADADGCLRVYKIDDTKDKGYSLREVSGEKISSSMCLCLDWDQFSTSIVDQMIVSLAVGISEITRWIIGFFKTRKLIQWVFVVYHKNPNDPYSVYTGSYDEPLRVWDTRSVSRPVNETSVSLGGGVWRIKHHLCLSGVVLAACMHNGFAVAKVGDGKGEVMENYKKHESLAYGADWYKGKDGKQSVVATCSFYDRLLRLWMPETGF